MHIRKYRGFATCVLLIALSTTTNAAQPKSKTEKPDDAHHYLHKTEKPHAAEWGYKGAIGPTHWASLSSAYSLAAKGRRQSPIDISMPVSKSLPSIKFDYRPTNIKIVYNGHTIEDIEDQKSSIAIDGKEYHLKQFHFHSPSEHTINDKHTAMEMHLVHATDSGQIAVVAVMIEQGKKDNKAYRPVWSHLPSELNKTKDYNESVDAAKMLPKKKSYYRYSGSFTTPPCTEDVVWLVLSNTVKLSNRQITEFQKVVNNNNRPVQPLNGRIVNLQSK